MTDPNPLLPNDAAAVAVDMTAAPAPAETSRSSSHPAHPMTDHDGLRQTLDALGLGQYLSVLVSLGYDDLELLQEMPEEELADVTMKAGMKEGHAKKLVRRLPTFNMGAVHQPPQSPKPPPQQSTTQLPLPSTNRLMSMQSEIDRPRNSLQPKDAAAVVIDVMEAPAPAEMERSVEDRLTSMQSMIVQLCDNQSSSAAPKPRRKAVKLTVPKGKGPGDKIVVMDASGQKCRVTLPAEAVAGKQITLEVPDPEQGAAPKPPDPEQEAAPNSSKKVLTFTVPEGKGPGDKIVVMKSGQKCRVKLPAEAVAGEQITVEVPITHIIVTIPTDWKGGNLTVFPPSPWQNFQVRPPPGSVPGGKFTCKLPTPKSKLRIVGCYFCELFWKIVLFILMLALVVLKLVGAILRGCLRGCLLS